jgi:hypothetical protein
MVIVGYSIGGYWSLLIGIIIMAIGGYEWLVIILMVLVVILLVDIGDY